LPASSALLIIPHGVLHNLPSQALQFNGEYLIARWCVSYTPNLQAFTQLRRAPSPPAMDRVLVCGVRDFQTRAPELAHARRESLSVRRIFPSNELWWGASATPARLRQASQRGQLRRFSILHFATHATINLNHPQLSEILLGEGALRLAEIPQLALHARLVTLSACSGNLGPGGSGDEWVSLTRAFFYAGARALVASLWEVEDASTARLMEFFYRALRAGQSIGAALRAAQLELIKGGATPYQWASFVAIGDV
jgi:CHAT domain-containing protein